MARTDDHPGSPPGTERPSGEPLYARDFDAFRGKTLEQSVRELADREEIRELPARYAHRVAHGKSFIDLFVEDCRFIIRMPGAPANETVGRKALAEKFAIMPQGLDATLPMIHNHLIAIDGDEASGLSSIELRATHAGKSIIGSGYYNDRYRRENGRWKYVVREATFFHYVPIQQGWAAPAGSE